MNEQVETTPAPSEEYTAFLSAVEKNGAYVRILVEKDGVKKVENWNVKKGAKDHNVTDANLIGFRPLTRKEQRAIFHTPYKYGRRVKA
jgi:hypothetical protein